MATSVVGEFPHCPVCSAPASLRAVNCAVCDAPLPPSKAVTAPTEVRSGEWVRFRRPPEELKELYGEVVKALLPNIRLLGMVGEGGMALVFVGRDSVLKREVAVKLLSPTLADDPVARKRFTREAEAIAAVAHPNIVNVYQVGELPQRDIPYFVMQFVDGPTLGIGSLHGRTLSEARVRRLMSDVAAGLGAAHRRKVFHRDIKPGNIVLDGETGRAMVLDFGISAAYSSRRHSLGRRLTEEGMYVGTPTYMSPEQASGEDVTGKSDVYSLGVLAFELLIGRPPFEGTPVAVVASHLHTTPPRVDQLRPDLSEEIGTLIARCLEKSPDRRPSAEDVVQFLSPHSQPVIEWPPPGLYRLRSDGARAAFEMIVSGFAKGDKNTLRPLLSDETYRPFAAAIDEREASGETLETRIAKLKDIDIVEAGMDGRNARITLKIVSDQINVLRAHDDSVVDGDPQNLIEKTDYWTFTRDTRSNDPNWLLVATGSG